MKLLTRIKRKLKQLQDELAKPNPSPHSIAHLSRDLSAAATALSCNQKLI